VLVETSRTACVVLVTSGVALIDSVAVVARVGGAKDAAVVVEAKGGAADTLRVVRSCVAVAVDVVTTVVEKVVVGVVDKGARVLGVLGDGILLLVLLLLAVAKVGAAGGNGTVEDAVAAFGTAAPVDGKLAAVTATAPRADAVMPKPWVQNPHVLAQFAFINSKAVVQYSRQP